MNERGHFAIWQKGYFLNPGHHQIRIENDKEYCGDESRWKRYVGNTVTMGVLGLAVTAIVEHSGQEEPVIIDGTVEAGKSYIIDCDYHRKPWAWMTPEDER